MNRKMTRFAFGEKCGAFGASGSAAAARSPKSAASAKAPKPVALWYNIPRRETSFGDIVLLLADAVQIPLATQIQPIPHEHRRRVGQRLLRRDWPAAVELGCDHVL